MLHGDDTYCGEHFVMYMIVESLCRTSETNIILHVDHTSIKKREKKEKKTAFKYLCLFYLFCFPFFVK